MQQRAEVTPKPIRMETVSEFLQSGKTMVAWSKERRINRFTLHNWVEEFRKESSLAPQGCEWMEVSVNTEADETITEKVIPLKPIMPATGPIRISIGIAQIEVTSAFDENALAAVIKAVKSQC